MITRTYPAETWDVMRQALRVSLALMAPTSENEPFRNRCEALALELEQVPDTRRCPVCGSPLVKVNPFTVLGPPQNWRTCTNCGSTIRVLPKEAPDGTE